MESQEKKSPHTLFWIAGIAVTAFSIAGLAAIMGWIPTSTGNSGESIMADRQAAAPTKPAVPITNSATAQARERARAQAPAQVADSTPARWRCAECGVVQSVREIVTKGEGSGIGAVGGAVVGGVLGHQVGGGSGQKIATVVGAVGGAVAGNEVEKHVKSGKSYEITVRLEDGSSRVISEATTPTWRAGDRVRIVNGVIQSNA